MKEVVIFRYLGEYFASNGRENACKIESQEYGSREMCRCAQECMEEWECLMETKRGMYEGIVIPTALYGSEAWVLENKVKNRMDVAEMSCLKSTCGVTRRDGVRNEEIKRKCGLQRSLSERGEAAVLW